MPAIPKLKSEMKNGKNALGETCVTRSVLGPVASMLAVSAASACTLGLMDSVTASGPNVKSMVNMASSMVSGSPLWKVIPSRNVRSHESPSSDTLQSVNTPGTISRFSLPLIQKACIWRP